MNLFILFSLLILEGIQATFLVSRLIAFSSSALLLLGCALTSLSVGLGLKLFGRRLNDQRWIKSITPFLIVEAIVTFLLVSFVFKMFVYPERPLWPHYAYDGMLIIAVIHKILWMRISRWAQSVYTLLMDPVSGARCVQILHIFFPVWIFLFLFVPDAQGVVARMYIGEHFHHMESFLVGPAYAFSMGNVLHIDTISRYGFGLPILFSYLTRIFGGVSYESVFLVLMWAVIAYYILWYLLLRRIFNSVVIAVACLLWGLKVQMFNQGGYPFMLTYPNGTPIRYWLDVVVFFFIYRHMITHQVKYLIAAGIFSGIAIFYMTDTGIYICASFYAYLGLHVIVPSMRKYLYQKPKDLLPLTFVGVIAPATALLLFWFFLGPKLFGPEFAANLTDFGQRYLNCFATEPMFQRVQEKQFLFSLIGFLYPMIYLGTILFATTLLFLRRLATRHAFIVVMAIYGLCAYQYHVVVSSSYYTHGLPCVFVLFYWLNLALARVRVVVRKKIVMGLIGVIIYAIVTNHMVLMYPNMFNISRNPLVDRLVLNLNGPIKYFNQCFIQYPDAFKLPLNSLGNQTEDWRTEDNFRSDQEVKDYYAQEFKFPEDVALIEQLTKPEEKVAVLASFEIKFLMDAHRKPLFYFFPIVNSRPLWMRNFVTTHMYTTTHVQKTIDQLRASASPYVFMEKIFLTKQIPQAYMYDSEDFVNILQYIDTNYEPYAFGKYLVAMKRKDT